MGRRGIWFAIGALVTLFVVLAAFGIVAIHLPGGQLVGWLGIGVLILYFAAYPWPGP